MEASDLFRHADVVSNQQASVFAPRWDPAHLLATVTVNYGVYPTNRGSLMPRSRFYVSMGLLVLSGTVLVGQSDPAMPPEAERQLAREIYKEMVEIKSGYTTGATT